MHMARSSPWRSTLQVVAAIIACLLAVLMLNGSAQAASQTTATHSSTLTATMPGALAGSFAAIITTNPVATTGCTSFEPTLASSDLMLAELVGSLDPATDTTALSATIDSQSPLLTQEVGLIPTMDGRTFVHPIGAMSTEAHLSLPEKEFGLIPTFNGCTNASLVTFNRQTIAGWADNVTTQKVSGANSATTTATNFGATVN